jgi:surface protein
MNRIISLLSIVLFIACSEDTTTMYNLTVSSNPTEGGTINPISGEYEEGSEVTIRVTTNTYYEFDKWSGSWSGSESPLTLTMDGDKNLVENFKLMDSDGDGVTDDIDQCKSTPSGQSVDSNGCSESQKDTDGDTVTDDLDQCPDTPSGETADENGCSDSQKDSDGDGVTDDVDQCINSPSGVEVDEITGCPTSPIYLDSNGVTIKAFEWAEVGETGEINGITYTIVSEEQLRDIVEVAAESNYNNLHQLETICTSKITDMSNLLDCVQFTNNLKIRSWDVSNVVDMSYMFTQTCANNLTYINGDFSYWDTSSVTNMDYMFNSSDFRGNISGWDVSNVESMYGMFTHSNFNGDISNWDVSNVIKMDYMFENNESFNKDISNWDVSSVKSMNGMFFGTIFNKDISNWDVSGVTEMEVMFEYNGSINQDLSAWDVSNVAYCTGFARWTDSWTLPKPNFNNCGDIY